MYVFTKQNAEIEIGKIYFWVRHLPHYVIDFNPYTKQTWFCDALNWNLVLKYVSETEE